MTTRKKSATGKKRTSRKKRTVTAGIRNTTGGKKDAVIAENREPPADSRLLEQVATLSQQVESHIRTEASLRRSRRRLLVVATLACLISLYMLFVYPRSLHRQPAIHSAAPAAPAATSNRKYPNTAGNTAEIREEAKEYMMRVREILEEHHKNRGQGKAATPGTAVSTAITPGINGNLLQPRGIDNRYKKDIAAMIYKWALAREIKDIDDYFSHYAKNFDPGDKAGNIDQWKRMRRYYINKPQWVKIKIEDIRLLSASDNNALVSFTQFYETAEYIDKTIKQLSLEKEEGAWRITRESSDIKYINFKDKP